MGIVHLNGAIKEEIDSQVAIGDRNPWSIRYHLMTIKGFDLSITYIINYLKEKKVKLDFKRFNIRSISYLIE